MIDWWLALLASVICILLGALVTHFESWHRTIQARKRESIEKAKEAEANEAKQMKMILEKINIHSFLIDLNMDRMAAVSRATMIIGGAFVNGTPEQATKAIELVMASEDRTRTALENRMANKMEPVSDAEAV